MIEQLLQLLVRVVDAQLFVGIYLRGRESSKGYGVLITKLLHNSTARIMQTTAIQTLKISNPAISRIPMKEAPWRLVLSKDLLILTTNHLNMRS